MICVFARADAMRRASTGKPRLLAGRPIYRNCEKCIYLRIDPRGPRLAGGRLDVRNVTRMRIVATSTSKRSLRCLPEYSGNAAWFDTPESASNLFVAVASTAPCGATTPSVRWCMC